MGEGIRSLVLWHSSHVALGCIADHFIFSAQMGMPQIKATVTLSSEEYFAFMQVVIDRTLDSIHTVLLEKDERLLNVLNEDRRYTVRTRVRNQLKELQDHDSGTKLLDAKALKSWTRQYFHYLGTTCQEKYADGQPARDIPIDPTLESALDCDPDDVIKSVEEGEEVPIKKEDSSGEEMGMDTEGSSDDNMVTDIEGTSIERGPSSE